MKSNKIIEQFTSLDGKKSYKYIHDGYAAKICHGVKDGNKEAIKEMALFLASQIHQDCALVPVPQHTGKAIYTLEIAQIIKEELKDKYDIEICDILETTPFKSLYEQKSLIIENNSELSNKDISSIENGKLFFSKSLNNTDKPFYFVDNVISTGRTYDDIIILFNKIKVKIEPLVFAISPKYQEKHPNDFIDEQTIKNAQNALEEITHPILAGSQTGLWTAFNDFKEYGIFDIIGKQIETVNGKITENGFRQLAAALEIYRDKRFETFRYIFVNKDGTLNGQLTLCATVPDKAIASTNKLQIVEKVLSYAEKTDTNVVLVHNHPSGRVEPSRDDIRTTDALLNTFTNKNENCRLAGHIILDHSKFSLGLIYKYSNRTYDTHWATMDTYKTNLDPLLKENNPYKDFYIISPQDLASLVKQINKEKEWKDKRYATVVFIGSDNYIHAMKKYPKSWFNKSVDIIKEEFKLIGSNTGSNLAIPIVYDKGHTVFEDRILTLQKKGAFTDFILYDKNQYRNSEYYNIGLGQLIFENDWIANNEDKIKIESTFKQENNTSLFSKSEGDSISLVANDSGVDKNYIYSKDFKSKFGDWEKANRLEKLKNSNDTLLDKALINADIDKNEFEILKKENLTRTIKKLVIANYDNQRDSESKLKIHLPDRNIDANLSVGNIKHLLSHQLLVEGQIEAALSIQEIANNAIYIDSDISDGENPNKDIKTYDYFMSGAILNGKLYTIKSVVGYNALGEARYYDQRATDIKKELYINNLSLITNKGEIDTQLINRYDMRLIYLCQVPQLPYMEFNPNTKQWLPTKETIQKVKEGKLYIQKKGQIYQMIDLSPIQKITIIDSNLQEKTMENTRQKKITLKDILKLVEFDYEIEDGKINLIDTQEAYLGDAETYDGHTSMESIIDRLYVYYNDYLINDINNTLYNSDLDIDTSNIADYSWEELSNFIKENHLEDKIGDFSYLEAIVNPELLIENPLEKTQEISNKIEQEKTIDINSNYEKLNGTKINQNQTTQQAQNWAIDKLRAAGIEVITDKDEFERILNEKNITQHMAQNKKSLKEQIDEVLVGNINRFDSIYMCDTPQIFVDAGLRKIPMLYSQKHLKDALKEEFLYENSHGLNKNNIINIPNELENPVMIMESASRKDSIVCVTSMVNDEDNPIIVSIKPNGSGFYDLKRIDSNYITSIYGKDGFNGFVKNAVENNRMIYCNKEKSQDLFSVLRIQFPQGLNNLDYNKIIKQVDSSVNQTTSQNLTLSNGITYGFSHEGKIYLNPDVVNSATPIHEYTHLWDNYIQNTNSELWNKGLEAFKDTTTWNEVINDPHYADIKDDENLILSECHSRITGRVAEKVLERIAKENGEIKKDEIIDWDKETWQYIAETYSQDISKFVSIKDFIEMPMKDLMNGMQPKKELLNWVTQELYEEADGLEPKEIFEKYDNKPIPIAEIPERARVIFQFGNVKDFSIYSGKAYFIDHMVNHHSELDISEYQEMQNDLDSFDHVYLDNKNQSIVFEKERNNKKYSIAVKEDLQGHLIFYKSYHSGTKTKTRFIEIDCEKLKEKLLVEVGNSSINHPEITGFGRLLSALTNNNNINNNNSTVNQKITLNENSQGENTMEQKKEIEHEPKLNFVWQEMNGNKIEKIPTYIKNSKDDDELFIGKIDVGTITCDLTIRGASLTSNNEAGLVIDLYQFGKEGYDSSITDIPYNYIGGKFYSFESLRNLTEREIKDTIENYIKSEIVRNETLLEEAQYKTLINPVYDETLTSEKFEEWKEQQSKQYDNDKKLSKLIAEVDKELEESISNNGEYLGIPEISDDEKNKSRSNEIFDYLEQQYTEYLDGTRDEKQLYGGNVENFSEALLQYTDFSNHYFEIEDLCLREAMEFNARYLFDNFSKTTNFDAYFFIPFDYSTSEDRTIKTHHYSAQIEYLIKHMEEFYKSDKWNEDRFLLSEIYTGHSDFIRKTLFREWDFYLDGKITEEEIYGGNLKNFVSKLELYGNLLETKTYIEMAQKEVEVLGTANLAKAIKEWQIEENYQFMEDSHPGELDKIILQVEEQTQTKATYTVQKVGLDLSKLSALTFLESWINNNDEITNLIECADNVFINYFPEEKTFTILFEHPNKEKFDISDVSVYVQRYDNELQEWLGSNRIELSKSNILKLAEFLEIENELIQMDNTKSLKIEEKELEINYMADNDKNIFTEFSDDEFMDFINDNKPSFAPRVTEEIAAIILDTLKEYQYGYYYQNSEFILKDEQLDDNTQAFDNTKDFVECIIGKVGDIAKEKVEIEGLNTDILENFTKVKDYYSEYQKTENEFFNDMNKNAVKLFFKENEIEYSEKYFKEQVEKGYLKLISDKNDNEYLYYSYNKEHTLLIENNTLEIINDAEKVEKIVNESTNLNASFIEKAKELIDDFTFNSYMSTATFEDIEHVGLAYTTSESEELQISVEANLKELTISTYIYPAGVGDYTNEHKITTWQLNSENDYLDALKNLDFDNLTSIIDDREELQEAIGFKPQTEEEQMFLEDVKNIIEENNLDVVITNIKKYEPVSYPQYNPDGVGLKDTITVLVEFTSIGDSVREDDFFEMLNEENTSHVFNGKPIDYNPITPAKSGTIKTFLERLNKVKLQLEKLEQIKHDGFKAAHDVNFPNYPLEDDDIQFREKNNITIYNIGLYVLMDKAKEGKLNNLELKQLELIIKGIDAVNWGETSFKFTRPNAKQLKIGFTEGWEFNDVIKGYGEFSDGYNNSITLERIDDMDVFDDLEDIRKMSYYDGYKLLSKEFFEPSKIDEIDNVRLYLDTPENRNLLKDVSTEKEYTQQAQNWAIDKLRAAGIEVISDKNEFNNILESEKILQKMSFDLSEIEELQNQLNEEKEKSKYLNYEKENKKTIKLTQEEKDFNEVINFVKSVKDYIPMSNIDYNKPKYSPGGEFVDTNWDYKKNGLTFSNNNVIYNIANFLKPYFVKNNDENIYLIQPVANDQYVKVIGNINDTDLYKKLNDYLNDMDSHHNFEPSVKIIKEDLLNKIKQNITLESQYQNKIIQEIVSLDSKIKKEISLPESMENDFAALDKSLRFNANFEIKSSKLEENVSVFPGSTGKHGLGIRHLIEQRYKYDNLSIDEITALTGLVLDSVRNGEITRKTYNQTEFTKNGIIAIVRQDYFGQQENWVLTGFAYDETNLEKNREATEAIKTVNAKYSQSQDYSYFRNQVGAVVASLDLNISDSIEKSSIQEMTLQDGTTYGFTHEGKIYLNPDVVNSATPIHEYTHLWDNYIQKTNSELWNKGLEAFKDTAIWSEVINDPHYADIKDDENLVLSECHARITGKVAEKVLERIAKENGEIKKDEIIDWDKETWQYIAETYSQDISKFVSIKDFIEMPMKDLMEGKDIIIEQKIANEKQRFDFEININETIGLKNEKTSILNAACATLNKSIDIIYEYKKEFENEILVDKSCFYKLDKNGIDLETKKMHEIDFKSPNWKNELKRAAYKFVQEISRELEQEKANSIIEKAKQDAYNAGTSEPNLENGKDERNYIATITIENTENSNIDSIVSDIDDWAIENNFENYDIVQNDKDNITTIRIESETENQLEEMLNEFEHQLEYEDLEFETTYDPVTQTLMREKDVSAKYKVIIGDTEEEKIELHNIKIQNNEISKYLPFVNIIDFENPKSEVEKIFSKYCKTIIEEELISCDTLEELNSTKIFLKEGGWVTWDNKDAFALENAIDELKHNNPELETQMHNAMCNELRDCIRGNIKESELSLINNIDDYINFTMDYYTLCTDEEIYNIVNIGLEELKYGKSDILFSLIDHFDSNLNVDDTAYQYVKDVLDNQFLTAKEMESLFNGIESLSGNFATQEILKEEVEKEIGTTKLKQNRYDSIEEDLVYTIEHSDDKNAITNAYESLEVLRTKARESDYIQDFSISTIPGDTLNILPKENREVLLEAIKKGHERFDYEVSVQDDYIMERGLTEDDDIIAKPAKLKDLLYFVAYERSEDLLNECTLTEEQVNLCRKTYFDSIEFLKLEKLAKVANEEFRENPNYNSSEKDIKNCDIKIGKILLSIAENGGKIEFDSDNKLTIFNSDISDVKIVKDFSNLIENGDEYLLIKNFRDNYLNNVLSNIYDTEASPYQEVLKAHFDVEKVGENLYLVDEAFLKYASDFWDRDEEAAAKTLNHCNLLVKDGNNYNLVIMKDVTKMKNVESIPAVLDIKTANDICSKYEAKEKEPFDFQKALNKYLSTSELNEQKFALFSTDDKKGVYGYIVQFDEEEKIIGAEKIIVDLINNKEEKTTVTIQEAINARKAFLGDGNIKKGEKLVIDKFLNEVKKNITESSSLEDILKFSGITCMNTNVYDRPIVEEYITCIGKNKSQELFGKALRKELLPETKITKSKKQGKEGRS